MLTIEEFGNQTHRQTDEYHGTKDLVLNLAEGMDFTTFEEFYAKYTRWYMSKYTKLGQALK